MHNRADAERERDGPGEDDEMTPDLLRKSPLVRYRSGKPSNLPPLRYAPCIRPRIPFFFVVVRYLAVEQGSSIVTLFFSPKSEGKRDVFHQIEQVVGQKTTAPVSSFGS